MARPRSCFAGATLMLLALASAACAPNEISIFIVQNQVPISGGQAGVCMQPQDPSGLHRNEGLIDVTLRDNYVMFPLYQNSLQSYRNPTAGRAETRGIFIDGADIELRREPNANGEMPFVALRDPSGATIPATYTVLSTTYVPPSTQGAVGLAVGRLEIIPSRVVRAMADRVCRITSNLPDSPVPTYESDAQRIVAVVRPYGHTMGGVAVGHQANGGPESQGSSFNFPITFCCHCLLAFPRDADDLTHTGRDCTAGTATATVCELGQDDVVDCRLCSGGDAVCQPPGFVP